MILNAKFEYGNINIRFDERNSFLNCRYVQNLSDAEELLGHNNYVVYSVTEKLGGKNKYKVKHYWSLITTPKLLSKHYTEGEVNEKVER